MNRFKYLSVIVTIIALLTACGHQDQSTSSQQKDSQFDEDTLSELQGRWVDDEGNYIEFNDKEIKMNSNTGDPDRYKLVKVQDNNFKTKEYQKDDFVSGKLTNTALLVKPSYSDEYVTYQRETE